MFQVPLSSSSPFSTTVPQPPATSTPAPTAAVAAVLLYGRCGLILRQLSERGNKQAKYHCETSFGPKAPSAKQ